jgi:GNAT superfamily N-acetyltransferase
VIEFLGRLAVTPGFVPGMNFGEVCWNGFRDLDPPFADAVSICETADGQIGALIWVEPPDEFALTVDLTFAANSGLLLKLAMFGKERLVQLACPTNVSVRAGTTALRGDPVMAEVLGSMGFETDGTVRHHTYRRELSGALDIPVLAEGFRFAAIADEDQLPKRIEVHLAVWPNATLDLANYRSVRQSPLYRPELDLVVVAPDGRYAAFLIGWYEPVSGAIQFEPIGARPEFRRLGLTRALIFEGLHRARELGARVAYINCLAENDPGTALYSACGFDLPGEWIWWTEP